MTNARYKVLKGLISMRKQFGISQRLITFRMSGVSVNNDVDCKSYWIVDKN